MSHDGVGGVASVDFQLDEFERAATLLCRAEDCLSAAGLLLAMALADGAPPVAGRGLLESRAAGDRLWAAQCLASEVADRLAACRSGLRASRAAYERAEREAARVAFRIRSATLFEGLAGRMAANHGHPDRQTTEDLINAGPGYGLAWLATGGESASDPAVQATWQTVARLVADREHGGPFHTGLAERLGSGLVGLAILRQLLNLRGIHVESASTTAPEHVTAPLAEVMELQRRAEAPVSGPGAVLVATTQTPAGAVHILTLPGTQPARDWRASARLNPFDDGGIAEGVGLGSAYIADAAAEALRAAGAHPGDRLVITGYSQGGIHAANLALDPELATDYHVEYVVTVGAPIGGTPLPETVRGLHLEHVDDMVPGLDGRPNPRTGNQVTVDFRGYAPGTEMEAGGFGAAHQLDNYAYLARELATSTDPAVVEARTALGAVFAGATSATVTTVSLRRGPATPDRHIKRKPVRAPLARGLSAARGIGPPDRGRAGRP